MTQIVVTLENGADSSLLRRAIENMKGVLKAKIHHGSDIASTDKTSEWIHEMTEFSHRVDPSIIDFNDQRTQYIMSR